ncbi:MAG TPA: patatin-like phospholipase family protein [Burkholderiales bacterium]|jgi:NTE family protein|nr:patatin-like phospholipase family protein [Burkholderiales bacterium]
MDERGPRPLTGLVLTGGGARAAYQVGVLRALSHILPRGCPNPFPIVCGTSAGAINAAALAASATDFHRAVRRLLLVWKHFHADMVYRADPFGVLSTGLRWLSALVVGGLGKSNPHSLLDNTPLVQLLNQLLDLDGIQHSIDAGALRAVAVTMSGYSSGQSVTFFQGVPGLASWERARRIGVPARIEIDHLLASSALPFIFPAVRIHREYFGDGSMRQIAPVSPALHLGADRVLVIGVGRQLTTHPERVRSEGYPSLAQIAGHALNSIFLDTLEVDLERLQRINRTVSLIPAEERLRKNFPLREIETLVIRPSVDLDVIAGRFVHTLPRSIRWLLRGLGATRRTGATLTSYLLFERPFCRTLINLGYRDTMARRAEVQKFITSDGGRPLHSDPLRLEQEEGP